MPRNTTWLIVNQSYGAVHHNRTDQILAFSVNHSTVVVQQQTPQQRCKSISPREVGELLEIFLRVVPGALLARRSFERKKKRTATRHHTANRRGRKLTMQLQEMSVFLHHTLRIARCHHDIEHGINKHTRTPLQIQMD